MTTPENRCEQAAAQGRERPREETEARLLRERGTPEERIGPVVPDGTLYPQSESAAASPPRGPTGSEECPACEEGYICRQGEGCLLVDVFGDEQPAASAPLRTPEQMEWIRDRFKPDGLERLARADREYADDHGHYLPDVAALAHAEWERAEALTELHGEVTQLRDDLATYVLAGEGSSWSLPMVLDELCRILADEVPDGD